MVRKYIIYFLCIFITLSGCSFASSNLPDKFTLATLEDSNVFTNTCKLKFSTEIEQKLAEIALSRFTIKIIDGKVEYLGISNSIEEVLSEAEIESFLNGDSTEETLIDLFADRVTLNQVNTDVTFVKGKISSSNFIADYVQKFVKEQKDYITLLKNTADSDVFKSIRAAHPIALGEFVCIPYNNLDTTLILHIAQINENSIEGEIINLSQTDLKVTNKFCKISSNLEVSYFNEKEEIALAPNACKRFSFTCNTDNVYWYDSYLNNLYKITNDQEETNNEE